MLDKNQIGYYEQVYCEVTSSLEVIHDDSHQLKRVLRRTKSYLMKFIMSYFQGQIKHVL